MSSMEASPPSLSVAEILRSVSLFSGLDSSELAALSAEMEWVRVDADEVLFEKGAPGDCLHIVVSGRLQAFDPDAPPGRQALGLITPGEAVGEMAALQGDQRIATVTALRDSSLLRLTRARFMQFGERNPKVFFNLCRLLIARIGATKRARPQALPLVTVVPVTKDARVDELVELLVAEKSSAMITRCIRSRDVRELIDCAVDELLVGTSKYLKLARWLQDEENNNHSIIMVADGEDSAWTKLCIRQADVVLLVVDTARGRELTPIAERLKQRGHATASDRRELVILHPASTELPRGTRAWLDIFPVDAHHHVRLERRADVQRVVRFLTGRAIALALSGGASRGLAHAGVLRALEETKIPIDLVCGTSMGSVFGGKLALGWTADRIAKHSYDTMVKNTLFDFTLPLVSALSAKPLKDALQSSFGDAKIEDLWIRYFCVASDLVQAVPVVLNTGSVAEAVLCSCAAPGFYMPVHKDGRLLVDGLFTDNLPAELAHQETRGKLIAVNVIQRVETKRWAALSEGISPLRAAARMMAPLRGLWAPPIMELVMQGFFISTFNAADRVRQIADVYIEPDLSDIGFLESSAFYKAAQRGYEETKTRLGEWMEREPSVKLGRF